MDIADSIMFGGHTEIYSGTTQMRPLANASGVETAERLRMIAAEIETGNALG